MFGWLIGKVVFVSGGVCGMGVFYVWVMVVEGVKVVFGDIFDEEGKVVVVELVDVVCYVYFDVI